MGKSLDINLQSILIKIKLIIKKYFRSKYLGSLGNNKFNRITLLRHWPYLALEIKPIKN